MEVKALVGLEPTFDRRRLMGRVVVENEVDVQVRGDGGLDRIQEAPEFARS